MDKFILIMPSVLFGFFTSFLIANLVPLEIYNILIGGPCDGVGCLAIGGWASYIVLFGTLFISSISYFILLKLRKRAIGR